MLARLIVRPNGRQRSDRWQADMLCGQQAALPALIARIMQVKGCDLHRRIPIPCP